MNDFEKSISFALNTRKEQGNLRKLELFDYKIDFASNDYLGFGRRNETENISHTSGSSRLIAGNHEIHVLTEQKIARFFNSPSALLYNSGYLANLGVIPTLIKRNDIIIYDELCHASMREAISLSKAKSLKFKHNDVEDLKRLIEKFPGKQKFILTEGLFSMTGDIAPIEEIIDLAKKSNSKIILDEAHSGGVFGGEGKGVLETFDQEVVVAKIITFGKAFGAFGAAVLSSNLIKGYLVNFSKAFIYTTAMSKASVELVNKRLNSTDVKNALLRLRFNIDYFNKQLLLPTCSHAESPIQVIKINNRTKLKDIETKLKQKGIGIKAILAPTVPEKDECLRVSIHSFNTEKEIKLLTEMLNEMSSQ